jgi:multidrug efflux system membrane fusion protein
VVPVLRKLDTYDSIPLKRYPQKMALLALVLAAIVALIVVIWQLQTSPETNDAYVYADTIDVVPEVSGRIVEMPIRDNQRVKKAICCSASTRVPTRRCLMMPRRG